MCVYPLKQSRRNYPQVAMASPSLYNLVPKHHSIIKGNRFLENGKLADARVGAEKIQTVLGLSLNPERKRLPHIILQMRTCQNNQISLKGFPLANMGQIVHQK